MLVDGFASIDEILSERPDTGRFCYGDEITMADVGIFSQVVNARNLDPDLAPFLTRHRISDAALVIPAFERAIPANQKDFE